MPTPIGHALAGVAAGCLVTASRRARSGRGAAGAVRRPFTTAPGLWHGLFALAAVGALPDVDFLVGAHSSYTHSVGATVVAGIGAALVAPRDRLRWGLAVAAAYGSHVLLDWLGTDTVAPVGIMALWPLSTEFYLSDAYWFPRVCREYWLGSCWVHNLQTLGWELVVLTPLAALGAILARRSVKHRPCGGRFTAHL